MRQQERRWRAECRLQGRQVRLPGLHVRPADQDRHAAGDHRREPEPGHRQPARRPARRRQPRRQARRQARAASRAQRQPGVRGRDVLEDGRAGATKLAADPTILSVIGTSCSSAALGVADTIFSKKGILLISPSNTGPALTAEVTHQPFYLRTAHNDKIQGAVVADFAKEKLGAKTAATIHDDSPYSDGLAAVFREVFQKQGGTITDNQAIQATDRDFKPVLNSIAQHKPDFLYYPAFNPACALIAKQARSIPALNNTKLTGSDGCADPEYVRIGGKDVYGTWDSSPDVTAQTSANAYYGQQFLPAYQKEFGQRPVSVFNAHAWDAAQILFAAIQKVAKNDNGTLTIPRTGLKEAVYQTKDYKGLSGTITCTPLGDCATAVSIAVYKVPAWPIEGGSANPKPVFTETKTLADVASG